MVTVIEKRGNVVVCKDCRSSLVFEEEDIIYKTTHYGNDRAVEGGEKPFSIERYFLSCPRCGGTPNVSFIASETMKKQAKERAKK